MWQECYATTGPLLQEYLSDFQEDMKDYLASRDTEITMLEKYMHKLYTKTIKA